MKFDLSAQKPRGRPLHMHFQPFWAPWHIFGYWLIGFRRVVYIYGKCFATCLKLARAAALQSVTVSRSTGNDVVVTISLFIAKLSFNSNFNLVDSWASLNFILSPPPPNHPTDQKSREQIKSLSMKIHVNINIKFHGIVKMFILMFI